MSVNVTNAAIAAKLSEMADLLAAQGANPFRVRAYRRAAESVAASQEEMGTLLAKGGLDALMALPHVGESLAAAIAHMAKTGRWPQLERLRGELDAEHLFATVPGIGPELARRIHAALHVDTLEALEIAAHDGRLDAVKGVGPRRVAAIRAALAERLARVRGQALPAAGAARTEPTIEAILDADALYRTEEAAGRLKTIAPRRFNPEGRAWLPILHARRGDWHFTLLHSNTARAHTLGRARDWVVVYFYDGDHREGQRTVVTETRGPLKGKRVVRGREAECRGHYATRPPAAD
ncbi:MAG: DNA-binding protein [Alphaproteobacteria bacterium]|nr:DNA-binding protein [Alphaproteobacteria bacterium]